MTTQLSLGPGQTLFIGPLGNVPGAQEGLGCNMGSWSAAQARAGGLLTVSLQRGHQERPGQQADILQWALKKKKNQIHQGQGGWAGFLLLSWEAGLQLQAPPSALHGALSILCRGHGLICQLLPSGQCGRHQKRGTPGGNAPGSGLQWLTHQSSLTIRYAHLGPLCSPPSPQAQPVPSGSRRLCFEASPEGGVHSSGDCEDHAGDSQVHAALSSANPGQPHCGQECDDLGILLQPLGLGVSVLGAQHGSEPPRASMEDTCPAPRPQT